MTNFYKGGSELSNEKDHSCSQKIKSKKIRAQLTELTTSFQLYFAYIFQALVKYYLSTDIVLFRQSLRKEINKGKKYYKSTWLVLGNCRLKSGNLPTSKWRGSGVKKRYYLDFLLTNFALTSAIPAAGLWSCTDRALDFPEASASPTRSRLDENSVNGRSWSGVGRYLNSAKIFRAKQRPHKDLTSLTQQKCKHETSLTLSQDCPSTA